MKLAREWGFAVLVLCSTHGLAHAKDESCRLSLSVNYRGASLIPAQLALQVRVSSGDLTLIDLPLESVRGLRVPIACGETVARLGTRTPSLITGFFEIDRASIVATPDQEAQFVWEVPALGRVRVRVEDPSGAAGAGVVGLHRDDQPSDRTGVSLWPDSRGFAEIVLPTGSYRLTVDQLPLSSTDDVAWNGTVLAPGAPGNVVEAENELVVRRFSRSFVRGIVVDERGEPIAQASVEARLPGGETGYADITRSDGGFVLPIDEFPAQVVVRDPSGVYEFSPGEAHLDREDRDATLRFEGRRASRFVEIAIIERETGETIPSATLWAQAEGSGVGKAISSDDSGIARVSCDGRADLLVMVERTPFGHLLDENPTRVEADSCGATASIRISRGAGVDGKLVNESGEVLAFASFVLSRPAGGVWHLRTDAKGEFRQRGLKPGTYRLSWRGHPSKRDGEASARRAIRLIEVGGKAARTPAAALGLFTLEQPHEFRSVVAQLVEAAQVCVDVRDRHARPLLVGRIDFHEPISHELVTTHEPETLRDVTFSLGDTICGRRDLAPGEYLVRVSPPRSEFVPAWWPGVMDERVATVIDLRSGVNTLGRMVVQEAETVVLSLPGTVGETASGLRFETSAPRESNTGDLREPLPWVRARRVSPSEVEVDFVPRGLTTLHVHVADMATSREVSFDLRHDETGRTRGFPRVSTKTKAGD